ncbi:MAG: hypothetical protein SGPRY_013928 [Prymnesium sp.]
MLAASRIPQGPEAYDTANIIMRFANGKEATIDVCRQVFGGPHARGLPSCSDSLFPTLNVRCRQAPYGYDQRAEVLGEKAMSEPRVT